MEYHLGGKIGLQMTKRLNDSLSLSLAYTPGVAEVCKAIVDDPGVLFTHTARSNLVAVVTDGTAVLGLGDIGAAAGIPVMEGKCVLFKAFGETNAWPIAFENSRVNGNKGRTDVDKLVELTASIASMYGGINLEDIAAPECFEVEDRLQEMLSIPVFHDDQWGTAVISLAGVQNYCIITGKAMDELKVVINGAGAAGIRIAEMLKTAGVRNLLIVDSKGVCHSGRDDLNEHKRRLAVDTTARTLKDALKNADLAVMVSMRFNRDGSRTFEPEWLNEMADYPGIFAMANPDPEISPEETAAVLGDKPYIMSTGRSDYPNQINNVLGFPLIFRGALDVRAKRISMEMKLAAARGIAALAREEVPDSVKEAYGGADLVFGNQYIIPKPFDRRLLMFESLAVAEAAVENGDARIEDMTNYIDYLRALAFTPKNDFVTSIDACDTYRFSDTRLVSTDPNTDDKKVYICDPNVEVEDSTIDEITGRDIKMQVSGGIVTKIFPA